MASKTENVMVVVRCRPFNDKEKAAGHKKVVETQPSGVVSLKSPKDDNDIKTYTFDAAFDEDCKQVDVYNTTARVIVDAVLEGFNGTVFCYGQTGTGKTFSMQGITTIPHLRGIIPMSFHHIFDHIARTADKKFLVRISFLEIYNEEIRDLLLKQPKGNNQKISGLDLKEHPETGVYVKDLQAFVVKSVEEMEQLMDLGNKHRSVGATQMNANSSRSHSIFTITIESSEPGEDGEDRFVAGKLHLVDLAGSERQSKTGASGDRLKEATKINLSLSALGNCISALVDGKSSHIPYRDSKLTRLLQDSLGGNAKTLMIATTSPASFNYDETLSTLRYANRAKSITNKPKVNEDPKDAMLREYQEEINRLKQALEARQKGGAVLPDGTPHIVTKIVKKRVTKKVKKIVPRKVQSENEGGKARASATEAETEEEEDDDDTNSENDLSTEVVLETTTNDPLPQSPLAGVDPETIARLQSEVEAEKKALLASKTIVTEEKQRIASELERRALELETERQARAFLAAKLLAMEGKLLIGGIDIEHAVQQQERQLEETGVKLQAQLQRERELKQQLEARQEAQLQMEDSYASLQDEVDIKSKKLKKLWTKLQAAKSEIDDLQDEFRNEKEDLLDTIRELSRELALKVTIMENFIPKDERGKIERRAMYDEERDDWKLAKLTSINLDKRTKRPMACGDATRRPVCQFAKSAMGSGDPNLRWRGENIITLKLDMPERTTFQSTAPSKSSRTGASGLQGALDFVFAGDDTDDEILIAGLEGPNFSNSLETGGGGGWGGGDGSGRPVSRQSGGGSSSGGRSSPRKMGGSDMGLDGTRTQSAKRTSSRAAVRQEDSQYPTSRATMKPKSRYA